MIKNIFKQKIYSFGKAKQILHTGYRFHKKKYKDLSETVLTTFEKDLQQLEAAIIKKDREEADAIARKLEKFYATRFKKSFLEYCIEIGIAVVLALFIAVIVRQMWFEPYEIPTGSMRPSFKEQDHLIVSKSTFGINTPLTTGHLLFEPELVQRGGVVIWSGDKVDLPDTDSTFFGLFPYKKRYIKRLIGKPGDIIYFYGGLLYGIDKDGKEIKDFRTNPWLQKLDHVPFMNFEGRTSVVGSKGSTIQLLFSQMNHPIGRILFDNYRDIRGEIFDGHSWVKDNPIRSSAPHSPQTFGDFWGIRNFAMARILTKDQVTQFSGLSRSVIDQLQEAPLYLELRHNPNFTYPQPRIFSDRFDRFNILLTPFVSVIPLHQKHIDAIMDNMYTGRFVVEKGQARRYDANSTALTPNDPPMPDIPNGTYEFYYGKASKIHWGGVATELPSTDPIYNHSPAFVQQLFNLGPIMVKAFEPVSKNQTLFPHRYAYFRDGALYLMGAPIFDKDDPALALFLEQEAERETKASTSEPYIAFKDEGAPMRNGEIDKEFIQSFGIQIPEKHYMVLGDNYSNSADSREFGFLPEANLQGTPSFIVWPPGSRWGAPQQLPYQWFSLSNMLVWGAVILLLIVWWLIHRWRMRKPQFKTLKHE